MIPNHCYLALAVLASRNGFMTKAEFLKLGIKTNEIDPMLECLCRKMKLMKDVGKDIYAITSDGLNWVNLIHINREIRSDFERELLKM